MKCNHPQPEHLADDSTASAGTIHWCPDCGAIRVVGQWAATPKPGAGNITLETLAQGFADSMTPPRPDTGFVPMYDVGGSQWKLPKAAKPPDPSPTPWDFNTWGFYCDACEKFFDLVANGKVVMREGNTSTPYHGCGAEARYIGYDHNKTGERP